MRVAELLDELRVVLNGVRLPDSQDGGDELMREAPFLDVEAPGFVVPHGVYILECLALEPGERQGHRGQFLATLTATLICRVRPTIEQGPVDVQAAWDLAELVGQTLMIDVVTANLHVDRIEYMGLSTDAGTCAHRLNITALYTGG